MESRCLWRNFRRHLFTLIALLGCIAPWVTPRLFQSESFFGKNPDELFLGVRRADPGVEEPPPVQLGGRIPDDAMCLVARDDA